MIPNIYMSRHKTLSRLFCESFAAGCGGKVDTVYKPGPWAGYGSPQLWPDLVRTIKDGHDFYYGDHAYFGRGVFFRVTKNAFQHDGRGEPDFDRLRMFHESAKPWRKDGRHILICTQTEDYYERFGIGNWLDDTLKRLKLYTDRPIVVREKTTKRPFMQDLQGAHCLVCCTSNTAVEALMEGLPVITTGACAASRMGLSDPALVEYPFLPDDRMEWAAALAANQWTFAEMAAGLCWEKIQ